MSWRFREHILCGELDYTVRGRVSGHVWLAGVAEPLVIERAADRAADMAACAIAFENSAPAARGCGLAGDITAA